MVIACQIQSFKRLRRRAKRLPRTKLVLIVDLMCGVGPLCALRAWRPANDWVQALAKHWQKGDRESTRPISIQLCDPCPNRGKTDDSRIAVALGKKSRVAVLGFRCAITGPVCRKCLPLSRNRQRPLFVEMRQFFLADTCCEKVRLGPFHQCCSKETLTS